MVYLAGWSVSSFLCLLLISSLIRRGRRPDFRPIIRLSRLLSAQPSSALQLCKDDYLGASQNDTLLPPFCVFMLPRNVRVLLKIKFHNFSVYEGLLNVLQIRAHLAR